MALMYGPAFDKEGNASGKLVEREVPDADIGAFEKVGYKLGPLTQEAKDADKAAKEAAKEEEKKSK